MLVKDEEMNQKQGGENPLGNKTALNWRLGNKVVKNRDLLIK